MEKPSKKEVMLMDLSERKMKYVEDLYYKKICSDKNRDLINKIQHLLFPDVSVENIESRNKITCGKIY